MAFTFRPEIPRLSTVVVKVGSRILSPEENIPTTKRVRDLVDSIAQLRQTGVRTLLVSSGAIARGMLALHLRTRPKAIPMKQACASIGQIRLMTMYETLFLARNIPIGQVLLTWDDLRNKKRYLNLRNTFFHLLDSGAVPVINENDSVGVEEIRFGDNDTLAAQIAMLVHAEVFVNLTDTRGLFDKNPKFRPDARHIPVVERFTPALFNYVKDCGSEISVGGMITKLRAAETVTKAGICAVIGDGFGATLLEVLENPSMGTVFLPSAKIMPSRRRWIAFTGKSEGSLYIDEGALKAIVEKGKSLLPAGVNKISGAFAPGAMVDVCDERKRVVARGMVNYSSQEILKIAGFKTGTIEHLLGQKTFDEVIHRDNLVVM
jgi:glutamate 5-kinase